MKDNNDLSEYFARISSSLVVLIAKSVVFADSMGIFSML
jgi:hypothetical protein